MSSPTEPAITRSYEELLECNQMDKDKSLPPPWTRCESRSRKGLYYFYNSETKESLWHHPVTHTLQTEANSKEKDAKPKSPDKRKSPDKSKKTSVEKSTVLKNVESKKDEKQVLKKVEKKNEIHFLVKSVQKKDLAKRKNVFEDSEKEVAGDKVKVNTSSKNSDGVAKKKKLTPEKKALKFALGRKDGLADISSGRKFVVGKKKELNFEKKDVVSKKKDNIFERKEEKPRDEPSDKRIVIQATGVPPVAAGFNKEMGVSQLDPVYGNINDKNKDITSWLSNLPDPRSFLIKPFIEEDAESLDSGSISSNKKLSAPKKRHVAASSNISTSSQRSRKRRSKDTNIVDTETQSKYSKHEKWQGEHSQNVWQRLGGAASDSSFTSSLYHQEDKDLNKNVNNNLPKDPTADKPQLEGLMNMQSSLSGSQHRDDIEMDVEEAGEEQMIVDIQDIRSLMGNWSSESVSFMPMNSSDRVTHRRNQIYIVLDTNILMGNLKFVNELKDQAFPGVGRPSLVIPWVVMQELDALKDNKGGTAMFTQTKAQSAVHYLNDCLKRRHPRVLVQTPGESNLPIPGFTIEVNDDKILQACIQWSQKYIGSEVMLLTNDIQLRNKSAVVNIKSKPVDEEGQEVLQWLVGLGKQFGGRSSRSGSSEMEEIPRWRSSKKCTLNKDKAAEETVADDILCKIKSELRSALTVVLETEMVEVYDSVWLQIIFKKPPWTCLEVLQCLNKHWIAVFGMFLPREAQQLLEPLMEKFKPGKGFGTKVREVCCLLDNAIQFLRFLLERDEKKYEGRVKLALGTFGELHKLGQDLLHGNVDVSRLAEEVDQPEDSLSLGGDTSPVQTNFPPVTASAPAPSMSPPNPEELYSDSKLQTVHQQFISVFHTIINARPMFEQMLSDPNSDRDQVISQFLPFLKLILKLDSSYNDMMNADLSAISLQHFTTVRCAINAIAQFAHIDPWVEMKDQELRMFYTNLKCHTVLGQGYKELQACKAEYHKLFVTLSREERECFIMQTQDH